MKSEGLASVFELIMTFGIKQGERAQESFAGLKEEIKIMTAGIAEEVKQNLCLGSSTSIEAIEVEIFSFVDSPSEDITTTPAEAMEPSNNVNGFAFKPKAYASLTMEPETKSDEQVRSIDTISDDNIIAPNEVTDSSANLNGFALETEPEVPSVNMDNNYSELPTDTTDSKNDATSMTGAEASQHVSSFTRWRAPTWQNHCFWHCFHSVLVSWWEYGLERIVKQNKNNNKTIPVAVYKHRHCRFELFIHCTSG
jgi:hypothetical protein